MLHRGCPVALIGLCPANATVSPSTSRRQKGHSAHKGPKLTESAYPTRTPSPGLAPVGSPALSGASGAAECEADKGRLRAGLSRLLVRVSTGVVGPPSAGGARYGRPAGW